MEEVPVEFLCPITQDIMTDPVVTTDGHTYERAAIQNWFKRKNTSPVTNERLSSKTLTPNITLRKLIRNITVN